MVTGNPTPPAFARPGFNRLSQLLTEGQVFQAARSTGKLCNVRMCVTQSCHGSPTIVLIATHS
jgi:hypothetical protein